MEGRSDDLSQDEKLPQPGTEEPDGEGAGNGSTHGPGNVSVDEPTEGALDADSLEDLPHPPGGADDGDADEDDTSDDTSEDTSGDEGDEGSG